MNLEQVLHQRWSDATTLNALLSADRVTTGRSTVGSLPRATLNRRSRRTIGRNNTGETLEEITVEMLLRHDQFDAAAAIVEAFTAQFDRTAFSLADGAKVLNLRRTEETSRQQPDGTWQFRVELLAKVYQPTTTN
jgi:hypothetical protein